MNDNEILSLINQQIAKQSAFATDKYGDTPTDANQLVPKKYVDTRTPYIGVVTSGGSAGAFFPPGWTVGVVGTLYTITHNLGTSNYAFFGTSITSAAFPRLISPSSTAFSVKLTDASGTDVNIDWNFAVIVNF